MNDLISRQAAIDALGDEPEVWTGEDEYAQGLNNQWHYDRNAILGCPSAQPDWIPTSERLPEPDVDVLLQLSDMMATGYWFYDGWHVYFSTERKDVIAWCKLPEPYAERRQNGSNKD